METSAILFAICLLLAGVWLIFIVSGDFKRKSAQAHRVPDAPRRQPHAPRNVSPVAPREKIVPSKAVTVGSVKVEVADQWQTLNASFIRETFEKFMRNS